MKLLYEIKYRIKINSNGFYYVQSWRPWFPVWCMFWIAYHSSEKGALEYIENMKYVKYV